jgi:conjugative transfer region lipoprotein (TIGR03751 family)
VVANSNGSLGTVGISGNEAMGRILAGGVRDMAEWVNKLYGQAFAAVYVQPSPRSPCTWNIRSTSTTTPRGAGSITASEATMRRIWIEALAAICSRSPGAGRLRHQQGRSAAARRPHHARRLAPGNGRRRRGTGGGQAARQLLDARQGLRRPLTEIDVQTPPPPTPPTRARRANEIQRQFRRLPNPDLVMYVFPHLAGSDPVPVPGYSTVFPLYQRVQYAMPGERVEDY